MRTFIDATGRAWKIEFDAPLLDAVEQNFGWSLDSFDNPPWEMLSNEPRKFVNLLAFVLASQIHAAGIDEIDFKRSIRDGALDGAALAMTDAVVDFFPERKRLSLRSRWNAVANLTNHADSQAIAKLGSDEAKEKVGELIDAALKRANTGSVAFRAGTVT